MILIKKSSIISTRQSFSAKVMKLQILKIKSSFRNSHRDRSYITVTSVYNFSATQFRFYSSRSDAVQI